MLAYILPFHITIVISARLYKFVFQNYTKDKFKVQSVTFRG